MPNHCFNHLIVSGPKESVLAFDERVMSGEGIVRTFLPFPAELEGDVITDADGTVVGRAFSDEGYKWCLANWGTKWGDYDLEHLVMPHDTGDGWSVTYSYDTAWSPAIPALGTIGALFPDLYFKNSYEELAMGYLGCFHVRGSQVYDCYFDGDDLPSQGDDFYDETLDSLRQQAAAEPFVVVPAEHDA